MNSNNQDRYVSDDYDNQIKELSFKEIFFILQKNQVLIFSIAISFILFTILATFMQKPVYQSSATIMIENSSTSSDIFEMNIASEKNYLENEIEILKSRTVSVNTIKQLLNSNHKNNLFLFKTRPYYHEFRLFGFLMDNEREFELPNQISDSLLHAFTKVLRKSLNVRNQKNTDMLDISIQSVDAKEAAILVDALISSYMQIDLEWENGEMSHLKKFLVEQIDKKEFELEDSEKKLKIFQEKEKIFGVAENSKILLNNLMKAETQLYESIAESNILSERERYIEGLLTDEEKKLTQSVTVTINERLFALKNEVAIKETELVSAISQQGEEHEIVSNLRDKLKKLKINLEKETRKLISNGVSVADPIKYRQALMDSMISVSALSATLNTKVKEFGKLVKQYESQLGVLPGKILEFTRLSRNLNIQTETYFLMRQKFEEARINEASQISKIRVIDQASLAPIKIKPNKRFNIILGIIFGLGIGLSIAFIIEFFDGSVKGIDEIEKRQLTILALIPSIESNIKKTKNKKNQKQLADSDKIGRRLITHEDPKSPISEAYRSLRTGLLYSGLNNEEKGRTVLISSPGPGEGKTTTIVNLAITFANLGKKTILVDTDLRKPVTHKVFNIDSKVGLSSYLSGNKKEQNSVIYNTEVDNLSIIPCGIIPPNPSEMLASSKMDSLIDNLKKEYDVILFDAPPLLAVTDAFVCMNYIDQFVLVVRAEHTQKAGLDRALEQIKQTQTPLQGVIMNDVSANNKYGGGYYNYYQYYYNSDEES